jgi:hypothetical protein
VSIYRLRARSIIHPGNCLIADESGSCYIFFADVGELSVTAIDHSLAEAMMQSYEWVEESGHETLTLADLQARATDRIPPAGTSPEHPQLDH